MATQQIKLSRDQLATFLKNHEQIRQFEQLFSVVNSVSSSGFDELAISIAQASASSNQNAAEISSILDNFGSELAIIQSKLNSIPIIDVDIQQPNILNTKPKLDYIDLNKSAPHTESPGRISWNDIDSTMDVSLEQGVTLQVGQETHARVFNNTGAMIPNGSVVGFAGAMDSALFVQPFIANGTFSTLWILGVMTHDIQPGSKGYATVWGSVRDLNTSAFSLGDILYASPTIAGEYTNIKPTAPNNVIPIAAVTKVGTTGSIFVRPTVEQDKRYGQIIKTVDQSPAVVNTAYAVTFTTAVISNGITLSSGSQITATYSGLYNFNLTFQIMSGSSSSKDFYTWFRKNGVDVANSSLLRTVSQNSEYVTLGRSDFFSLASGDYLEIMFACTSTNITIKSAPATAFSPSSPGAILAVTQVQQ